MRDTRHIKIGATLTNQPNSLVRYYIERAMANATTEYMEEDRAYYAAILGFRGVYATGDTQEAAVTELKAVLEDWIALRLRHGRALPAVDNVEC